MAHYIVEPNFRDIPTAIITYRRRYLIIKHVFCGAKNWLIFRNPYRSEFLQMCDDIKNPEISNLMEIKDAAHEMTSDQSFKLL